MTTDTTTDRFRGDPAKLETAEGIAVSLRAAAAWLKTAADALDAGDQAKATTYAQLGAHSASSGAARIAGLDA